MKALSPETLKYYSYFSGLSEGSLKELSRRLEHVDIKAGSKIIKEGDEGDSLYLIEQGEVEVTKKTKWDLEASIKILRCGEGFGEMALLTNALRNCSVTALTDVSLYRLQRNDFEEIIHMDSIFSKVLSDRTKDYSDYNMIKTLQPFALLEPEKMLALISRMKERTYAPGETIIKQGDKGTAYYIIKSGQTAVFKEKEGEDPHQVAILQAGNGFGEESLIREEPRNATVSAIDETIVYELEKSDFDKILKRSYLEWDFPEDIPEDERDRYVIIDARIEPEYKEEHIKGALNIPIEILRDKYKELNPDREYYTYCTNDSRGMTAAFLLRSMGFKAKTLRGGLSAWDGPTVADGDGVHLPEQKEL